MPGKEAVLVENPVFRLDHLGGKGAIELKFEPRPAQESPPTWVRKGVEKDALALWSGHREDEKSRTTIAICLNSTKKEGYFMIDGMGLHGNWHQRFIISSTFDMKGDVKELHIGASDDSTRHSRVDRAIRESKGAPIMGADRFVLKFDLGEFKEDIQGFLKNKRVQEELDKMHALVKEERGRALKHLE